MRKSHIIMKSWGGREKEADINGVDNDFPSQEDAEEQIQKLLDKVPADYMCNPPVFWIKTIYNKK